MKNTPRHTNRPLTQTKYIKLAVILSAACFSVILGGCNNTIAPQFSAVGVRVIEQSETQSVIEFSIEATNPNKEPMPMRQLHYTVSIDGVELFSGMRSPEITLHTYSSHVFKLPAVIPTQTLSGDGTIGYSLVGLAQYIPPGRLSEVLFDAELKVPEAEINLSGSIDTSK